jgi:site-specific recombinase XerD
MIQNFMEFLATTGYRKKNGAAARAKRLVTIRTFFRYLYREGLLRRDPAENVEGPKVTYTEPHFLQKEEYRALIKGATGHSSPTGYIAPSNQLIKSGSPFDPDIID